MILLLFRKSESPDSVNFLLYHVCYCRFTTVKVSLAKNWLLIISLPTVNRGKVARHTFWFMATLYRRSELFHLRYLFAQRVYYTIKG